MKEIFDDLFKQSPYKPPMHLSTLVISLCFAAWIFIIPIPIGIILLFKRIRFDNEIIEKYETIDNIRSFEAYITKICDDKEASINSKEKALINKVAKFDEEIKNLKSEKNKLKKDINDLKAIETIEETLIPLTDDTITSEEYKTQYSMLVLKEKDIIKNKKAIDIIDDGLPKKQVENDVKQILRLFNSETDTHIRTITSKNISVIKQRIIKSYEALNKLFLLDGVKINSQFLQTKLEQADLMYSYEYQKEQEKLQQKAIREQMVEEEKVRREIEKEKQKIEKEEKHFHNEISKLMSNLKLASDVEKQLYIDKINELDQKLKELEANKKNVLDRESNTRAGYVYIISNIGSFGEDVFKIGMTRRLDPLDRVSELGSASVPFEFDVHAMIFSEDAPALESLLHNAFADKRVNLVNKRKEFFRVNLNEIASLVKEKYNATVQFTMVAEAAQFRESQRMQSITNPA